MRTIRVYVKGDEVKLLSGRVGIVKGYLWSPFYKIKLRHVKRFVVVAERDMIPA